MLNKKKKEISLLLVVVMIFQCLLFSTMIAYAENGVVYSTPIGGEIYHTVRFLDHDGTVFATQFVKEGNTAQAPESPVREGHRFKNWLPATDTLITTSTDFVAQYEALSTYTIRIKYVYGSSFGEEAGQEAKPDFVGVYEREGYNPETIISPVIPGLKPQVPTVTVNVSEFDVSGECIKTVAYDRADMVNFTIKRWLEKPNLLNDPANSSDYDYMSEDIKQGFPGDEVYATMIAPIPEGFVLKELGHGTLNPDGTTVLNNYFTRKTVSMIFYTNGGNEIENLKGKYGNDTKKVIPNPTRDNYTFDGWYADPEFTQKLAGIPNTFPDSNKRYYAKWRGAPTTYTVNHWVERTGVAPNGGDAGNNPANYVFASKETKQGIAGEFAPQLTINGPPLGKNYHHYSHQDQNIIVEADGSTEFNVYYKYNVMTLSFTFPSDTIMTFKGTDYKSGEYKIITKLDENIADRWPAYSKATFRNSYDEERMLASWKIDWDINLATNPMTFTQNIADKVLSGQHAIANFNNYGHIKALYLFEQYPGQDTTGLETRNYNGKNYVESKAYSMWINATNLSSKPITGMVARGTKVESTQVTALYYDRNKNNIIFTTNSNENIPIQSGVMYNQPLKDLIPAGWDETKTKQVDEYTYYFDGWYSDPDFKNKIDFNTELMPNANLMLYAKWQRGFKTVTFYAQNGTTEPYHTMRVVGGMRINPFPLAPTREHYTFDTWYKDPEYIEPMYPETWVRKDMNLYAKWLPIQTGYTVKYLNSSGRSIMQDRVIFGQYAGEEVVINPQTFDGYTVTSSAKTIVLDDDPEKNIITFVYTPNNNNYQYTVKYIKDSDGSILKSENIKTSSLNHVTESFVPIDGYYPTETTKQLQLSATGNNEIVFRYKPYVYVEYKISHYKQNEEGNYPTIPTEQEVKRARLYDTAVGTAKTYPGYTLDGATNQNKYIASATDSIELIFKYSKNPVIPDIIDGTNGTVVKPASYVTVEFKPGLNGTLAGSTKFYVNPSATKTMIDITTPTIDPSDGYTIADEPWNPAFVKTESINVDKIYTAQYKVVTAPGKPIVEALVDGSVVITPPTDPDIAKTAVKYTMPDGTEKTVEVVKNGEGKWSTTDENLQVNADTGVVIIPENKVKAGSTVKAIAMNTANNISDEVSVVVKPEPDIISPGKPTIEAPTNGSVVITPSTDSDIAKTAVKYTMPDGTEKTVEVVKNGEGKWSTTDENLQVNVDTGIVTIPNNKVKGGSIVKATAIDKSNNSSAEVSISVLIVTPDTHPVTVNGSGSNSNYNYYTINVSVEAGGTITPFGNISVREGTDKTFAITPDKGYVISDVIIDGKSVGGISSYTFEDIRTSHTISVIFQNSTDLNKEDHCSFIKGYPDGTFGSEKNMTRGEVTAMFARLLTVQMEEDKIYPSTFSDVSTELWSSNAIGYMQQYKIIGGYPDGTFQPDAPISRAEFAAMASRFENLTEEASSFADVPKNHWAYENIMYATKQDWVFGYPDGTFKPDEYISRAEVVAITCRILERQADQSYITTHYSELPRTYSDITKEHWAFWYVIEASNGHDYSKDGNIKIWTKIHK